jgi:hypothetical protein
VRYVLPNVVRPWRIAMALLIIVPLWGVNAVFI